MRLLLIGDSMELAAMEQAEALLLSADCGVTRESAAHNAADVDYILLCMPAKLIQPWTMKHTAWVGKPLLWWFPGNGEQTAHPADYPLEDLPVDGVLMQGMGTLEVKRALYMSAYHFRRRSRWAIEKGQLLASLEERKWIDAAKGILCQMKNFTEPEAYEFLRKEAMNQRKRVVDVASSIVSVYKLLEDGRTSSGKKRR